MRPDPNTGIIVHHLSVTAGDAAHQPEQEIRLGNIAGLQFTPRMLVPIHFEGWSHFSEDRAAAEKTFAEAGVATRWLPRGERSLVAV